MYKNIGKKLMGLAKFLCWAGIVCSVIVGGIMILTALTGGGAGGMVPTLPADGTGDVSTAINATMRVGGTSAVVTGILVIVLGALGSWIGSWILYGFGELIQNVKKIANGKDED